MPQQTAAATTALIMLIIPQKTIKQTIVPLVIMKITAARQVFAVKSHSIPKKLTKTMVCQLVVSSWI